MLLLAASLLSVALAAPANTTAGGPDTVFGTVTGFKIPQRGENVSYWDDLAKNPEASSHVTFKSYKVSDPFPAVQVDGFSLDLYIADRPAIKGPDGPNVSPDDKSTVTVASLALSGPPGVGPKQMDKSWSMCNTFYQLRTAAAKPKNGSCQGVLSDKCLASLTKKLADNRKNNDCGLRNAFDVAAPDCDGMVSWNSYSESAFDTDLAKSTRGDTMFWRNDLSFIPGFDWPYTHDASNRTVYDQVVKSVWVVPVVFNKADGLETPGTTDGGQLICMQADKFAAGAPKGGSSDKSFGIKSASASGAMALFAAAAALIL